MLLELRDGLLLRVLLELRDGRVARSGVLDRRVCVARCVLLGRGLREGAVARSGSFVREDCVARCGLLLFRGCVALGGDVEREGRVAGLGVRCCCCGAR